MDGRTADERVTQDAFDSLCRRSESSMIQVTPARRAILQVIAGYRVSFTPAELEEEVGRNHPDVGRATVFRTLKILREAGILGQVELGPGRFGYIACPLEHHHHMICNSCGIVEGIHECGLDEYTASIAEARHFKPASHTFNIYGLCSKCSILKR